MSYVLLEDFNLHRHSPQLGMMLMMVAVHQDECVCMFPSLKQDLAASCAPHPLFMQVHLLLYSKPKVPLQSLFIMF